MSTYPVLIAGQWRASAGTETFAAENPATQERTSGAYPISPWSDCDAALTAAAAAASQLRGLGPEPIADFLERYAAGIEAGAADLVEIAHAETALPKKPRLAEVELPRTSGQLRQAAAAVRERSWCMPTIDTKANIRSYLAPLGPVWVFGPNNFPFAFNSISGGDFAAALAAGNPVIAKANSSHPGTTRVLGEIAQAAATAVGLPTGTVQLIYRTAHADGERAVADPRTAASGYTGSRSAGLRLKAAADAAGKLFYCELSSVNPVVFLPGALVERGPALAAEFAGSCLMGTGQFCTNPGLILLIAGDETEAFIVAVGEKFAAAPIGTLLSAAVGKSLAAAVDTLRSVGARVLAGGKAGGGQGHSYANTLLRTSASKFVEKPHAFQTEAFGNASLIVVGETTAELRRVLEALEGNLTGSIYSDTKGSDDAMYDQLAPTLRRRVGRLLNDKMPTGVAVSPAMNHGGPFPATGHPGFTAVGIPAALRRFAALECFDNVRPERLPEVLKDRNPTGKVWRSIDGAWTQG